MREFCKCKRCGRAYLPYKDGLCHKCRKQKENQQKLERDLKELIVPPKRKCHDCGKPTDDYRCEACWAKLQARLGIAITLECSGTPVEKRLDGNWVY